MRTLSLCARAAYGLRLTAYCLRVNPGGAIRIKRPGLMPSNCSCSVGLREGGCVADRTGPSRGRAARPPATTITRANAASPVPISRMRERAVEDTSASIALAHAESTAGVS